MKLLMIALPLLVAACQIANQEKPSFLQETRRLGIHAQSNAPAIVEVDDQGCQSFGTPKKWTLHFRSPFGQHELKIDYDGFHAGEDSQVLMNQQSYSLQIPLPFPRETLAQICSALAVERKQLVFDEKDSFQSLESILTTFAPDCQPRLTPKGELFCEFRKIDTSVATNKIGRLHKKLINSWKRHPYLLARRIAIGRKLAISLASSDQEKQVLRLCDMVKQSIPAELPIALRSQTWFQGVCLKQAEDPTTILQISLHDVLAEVENLIAELRSSSRLGTFSVRIPTDQSPSRDFWVSLKPMSISRAKEEQLTIASRFSCWHPLYDSWQIHFIAKELGLLQEPSHGSCRPMNLKNLEKIELASIHYIKNSIASETEFAISNGRSKVLRLPTGDYSYTVQSYSESETFYPRSSPDKSSGVLNWKDRRPRMTIRTW